MSKKKEKKEAFIYTSMKEYFVMDKAGREHEVEYSIKVYETKKGVLVKMFYADNSTWDDKVAGKEVASVLVKDDGTGYIWKKMPISEEHDHSDAYVMSVMLNFLDSLNSVKCQYSIVEASTIVNVYV